MMATASSWLMASLLGRIVVNELLASAPCLRVLKRLQRDGVLAADARPSVGDAVSVKRAKGRGTSQGADAHVLIKDRTSENIPCVTLAVSRVRSRKSMDQRKVAV